MKALTLLLLIHLPILIGQAQSAENLLFPPPKGLLDLGADDHKFGRHGFVVSFKKRYVATWRQFACGPTCTAGGYFINPMIDFEKIRLFTLENRQVLLELVAPTTNKKHCKHITRRPIKINDYLSIQSKADLFSSKPYNLTRVTGEQLIEMEVDTDRPKQNILSEDANLNSVNGQFCIDHQDIYFWQQLDDLENYKAFKVLVITDK